MKIIVHTLATDDDMGTSSGAYATEDQMYDALIAGTGGYHTSYDRSDFEEWRTEKGDPELTVHDWWEEHHGDLDSYSCDEVKLDIDLLDQPYPDNGPEQVAEAIECLQRARELLKLSGNLRTLLRVRSALSSAKGAARIQISRRVRAEMEDLDKADQKHNAQMLDACETEDEVNAELRHQTQGN